MLLMFRGVDEVLDLVLDKAGHAGEAGVDPMTNRCVFIANII